MIYIGSFLLIRELPCPVRRLIQWLMLEMEMFIMFRTQFGKFLILSLALIVILACNTLAAPTPQPAATLNALYTSAAQTLSAMATQGASTAIPGSSPTATLSIPTSTPLEFLTFTPVPPITRCDAASFVADVTYPDGSTIGIGTSFTKIWRIRNIGTCT